MPNAELIHASICAGVGGIGIILLIAAAARRQITNEQPRWGEEADEIGEPEQPAVSKRLRSKLIFATMIALIALTALASIVTVVIAARA